MQKTVALLTTWLDNWYQSQLWRGAVQCAQAKGARLLCLVGHTPPDTPLPLGPESIFGLAGRAPVDGVLLSSTSLSFWRGPLSLPVALEWLGHKAKVSLGYRMKSVDSVFPEGSGIEELVAHLVNVHDCHRIAFIGGPSNNPDAARRLADYRAALQSAGIPYDPERVEIGNFHLEGGMEAMRRLLEKGIPVDAVVAANDAMAIGAARALKEKGKRIPREVRLAGFDDSQEGRFLQPPLTTVANPAFDVAHRGLEMCLERIVNPSQPCQQQSVATKVLYRKSCGCLVSFGGGTFNMQSGEKEVVEMLVGQLLADSEHRHLQFLHWLQDQLSSEAASALEDCTRWVYLVGQELQRKGNSERVSRAIEFLALAQEILYESQQGRINTDLLRRGEQVRNLHRLESALLAHVEPAQLMRTLLDYLPEWCPDGIRVFMHNEDFSPAALTNLQTAQFAYRVQLSGKTISPIPDSEDILPAEFVPGEIWIAVPIEQGDLHFGVMLFRNWLQDEAFVEHLRMAFSTAFAISWRTRAEAELRDSLRRLSLRDELTGLYNRRGLMEISHMLTGRARREKKRLVVMLMDLDGLKQINDQYGHADGDLAIATFGQVLQTGFRTTDVVARFGGDEFAAVLVVDTEEELHVMLERFHRLLKDFSHRLAKPWSVRTSMGWSLWNPDLGSDLEIEMAKADQRLYEDKARNKAQRIGAK